MVHEDEVIRSLHHKIKGGETYEMEILLVDF
jgi:hypothetical protein